MRLRIFDLNTPWFWVTIFAQNRYAKPWFEISVWSPNTFKKWWIHFWMREPWPDERGAYAALPEDQKMASQFVAED
jgi:hypothetical protein